MQADGHWGHAARAPYDAIHVGAAAQKVPQALVEQLAPGGRLVIPVGPEGQAQELVVLDKCPDGSILDSSRGQGVFFVPLIPRHEPPPPGD